MLDTYDEEINNLAAAYSCENECNGKNRLPRAPYILRDSRLMRERGEDKCSCKIIGGKVLRPKPWPDPPPENFDLPDCPGDNHPTIQRGNLLQRIIYCMKALFEERI